MSSADWTFLTNVLNSASVARGVTAGLAPPSGGGSFVYGMNSLQNNVGLVGLYTSLANFVPMAKGGDIRGAIRRGLGGGVTLFAPYLFVGLGGIDVADNAYILGLADADPAHIVLRKGPLNGGLPDVAPGTGGVLARSTATYAKDTWQHLRLVAVANPSGDVVLNVYRNDLDVNPVTAPVWAAVPGMSGYPNGIAETAFIDDALGVNSGSLPYTSGRAGFAGYFGDVTRRCYFDHIVLGRQT